jgi:O-antigen/teichoic acid export membrane protein
MLKKYSTHIFFQYLAAAIPYFLLPYLYNSFSSTEFIIYSSLSILSTFLTLFDMRLGVLVLNAASKFTNFKNQSDKDIIDYLYSYYCVITACLLIVVVILGPFFSHYITGEISIMATLLYIAIPSRLMIGFYRQLYFGTGNFNFPNVIMFIFALLKLSGIAFLVFGFENAFNYFCLLYLIFSLVEVVVIKSKMQVTLNFSMNKNMFMYIKKTGLIIFITALISHLIQNADKLLLPSLISSDDLATYMMLSSLALSVFIAFNPFLSIINRRIAISQDNMLIRIINYALIFLAIVILITQVLSNYYLDDFLSLILKNRFNYDQIQILNNLVVGNILFIFYGILYFVVISKDKINIFLLFNIISFVIYIAILLFLSTSILSLEKLFSKSWMLLNVIRVIFCYPILLIIIFKKTLK